MAAGDRIFYLRLATKNVTQLDDVTHATFSLTGAAHVDDGDSESPGPEEVLTGAFYRLTATVFGKNLNTLLALLGSAAENLVLATKGVDGANEKITLKNWRPIGLVGPIDIPRHIEGVRNRPDN